MALGAAGLASAVCMLQATVHAFGVGANGVVFGVVYSIGVALAGAAVIPGEARTASDALRLADERMYANKRYDGDAHLVAAV